MQRVILKNPIRYAERDMLRVVAGSDLATIRAGKAAGTIHATEVAAAIAKRIKDASALEKALLAKLENQREFAKEYKANFPSKPGPGRGNKTDASTGVGFTKESHTWCASYGFAWRTVQRWCELLIWV